jgi:hypothetical protein
MGSANSTQPAFDGRNVEFMVELTSDQGKRVPSRICKSLTESANGEFPLFEPYQIDNREDETGEANLDTHLRKIIFDLTGLDFEGELSVRETGVATFYDLSILVDATSLTLPKDFDVRVKPLPETSALAKKMMAGKVNRINEFKGYNELQLSPYLQVDILYQGMAVKSFVAEMKKINLPSTRMDAIFRSIIDDKEKFLKYLSFLLGRATPESVIQDPESKNQKKGTYTSALSPALYESFLEAASRRPERLRSVEKIIHRLRNSDNDTSPILTDEFMKLWKIFENFLKRNNK